MLQTNDAFVYANNLLTTQLRHQDPLEPTKQEDFISQLAQFATLEGIEKLNENVSDFITSQTAQGDGEVVSGQDQQFQKLADAATLVGTEVVFGVDGDEVALNTGVVESIVFKDQTIHARIGDSLIPLEQISEISKAGGFDLGELLPQ